MIWQVWKWISFNLKKTWQKEMMIDMEKEVKQRRVLMRVQGTNMKQ
jgi:hypothetical protein